MPKSMYWPKPKGRALSASSDLDLYYLSLNLADKFGSFNKELLADELGERVKGLLLIKELSTSALDKLIKELIAFGWVDADVSTTYGTIDIRSFTLTKEGKHAHRLYKDNRRKFLHLLIRKMHKEYTIPGWFVDRLWRINPEGKGQVIIPSPIKSWNPESRLWEDTKWDEEISKQTIYSKRRINNLAPGSFEISDSIWVQNVKFSWDRLGSSTRRRYKKRQKVMNFSPRRRLALAMREAAVQLLFNISPPQSDRADFDTGKSPLEPRSFAAWCPRLDELELIFYTDFDTRVPGRIIFPVAVFKDELSDSRNYEAIRTIKNLSSQFLCLHKPSWPTIKPQFEQTLFTETQRVYKKTRALYVSVQDVRDEVCRQLRISSSTFNEYLEKAAIESLDIGSEFRISLETDIREDQRTYYQQRRRAVIVKNKLISLIAITKSK